jgi:Cu2+-exporting ATPase/Cu+-exporting ATPase
VSLCRLYFTDRLRPESVSVLSALKKIGMQCRILSGDNKERTQAIGLACGLPPESVHASLFPEDKKNILEKYPDTCMLGDGANDSLSLEYAGVGIAVKGSVDLSLSHSDVYFTQGGLNPLLELIRISKKTRSVLIRNLSISLIYNLVGGTLALYGLINPMLAAVLMPISSLLVILSSVWEFR